MTTQFTMTSKQIALHLIKEDLKYHRLVHHLAQMDVHLEFYPDIARAVQALLFPDLVQEQEQQWTDRYVQLIGMALENPPYPAERIVDSLELPGEG